jgi:hypothetical protein
VCIPVKTPRGGSSRRGATPRGRRRPGARGASRP